MKGKSSDMNGGARPWHPLSMVAHPIGIGSRFPRTNAPHVYNDKQQMQKCDI